jgi:ankyrin repeat protein
MNIVKIVSVLMLAGILCSSSTRGSGLGVNSINEMLINAAHKGNMAQFQKALNLKADVTFSDEDNQTALHRLVQNIDDPMIKQFKLSMLRKLLANPLVDINAQTLTGDTPLHLAVVNGYAEAIDLLKKQDLININIVNGWGISPLGVAASIVGNPDITCSLLFAEAHLSNDELGQLLDGSYEADEEIIAMLQLAHKNHAAFKQAYQQRFDQLVQSLDIVEPVLADAKLYEQKHSFFRGFLQFIKNDIAKRTLRYKSFFS